jgi:hypothetical protein
MNNQPNQYIKQCRKFHDAWAFVLYAMLYVGCTTYTVLNIKETGPVSSLDSTGVNHGIFCLAIVSVFILLNFGGLYLFPEFFLKFTISLFPVIIITLAVMALSIWSFLFAILTLIPWGFFVYSYWSKLKIVGAVLKSTIGILIRNIFTVLFGIVLCSSLQIIQLLLILQIDFDEVQKNLLLHILIVLNMYWSMANFIYFYKVYSTNIIAFHFINIQDTAGSVFSGAIKNTFYALGSISFAGFIVAIVNTLRYFINRERRSRRDSRESNLLADIMLCLTEFLLSILQEIIEFANELTLPYLAIHGEGYVQSMRNAYEMLTRNSVPLGGSVALNYSLVISSLSVSTICTGSAYYTSKPIGGSLEVDRIIKIVIITLIPLIFYFTTMMIISSSFLGLVYFAAECPDVVKEADSELEINLRKC